MKLWVFVEFLITHFEILSIKKAAFLENKNYFKNLKTEFRTTGYMKFMITNGFQRNGYTKLKHGLRRNGYNKLKHDFRRHGCETAVNMQFRINGYKRLFQTRYSEKLLQAT